MPIIHAQVSINEFTNRLLVESDSHGGKGYCMLRVVDFPKSMDYTHVRNKHVRVVSEEYIGIFGYGPRSRFWKRKASLIKAHMSQFGKVEEVSCM